MHEPTADVQFGDPRLPARFWAKVQIADNGCWHWTGAPTKQGYATFKAKIDGDWKKVPAHRYLYTVLVKSLPEAPGEPGHLEVDHHCHNLSEDCPAGPICLHRRCVNPAHLRAVPPAVNSRAAKARIKRCYRGHEFTPENTWMVNYGRDRQCRTCARENRLAETCRNGHPYVDDNLIVIADGRRRCAICTEQNKRDMTKPVCGKGHAFTEANTYIDRRGKRSCRACRAAASARARKRRTPTAIPA